ncbi:MAG: hypothetical protein HZA51_00880 [Planctomycetes bacterium]|nr:hypothetical protein [Planctomycetota bacterium]
MTHLRRASGLPLVIMMTAVAGFAAEPNAAPRVGAATSRAQLVLWPACDMPLVVLSLRENDESIQAEAGTAFLLLPFVYDGSAGGLRIQQETITGKDARDFIGVRLLSAQNGRIALDDPDRRRTYDSLESDKDSNSATVKLIKTKRGPGKKRDVEITDEAEKAGWAALVFRVREDAKQLSFQWTGGNETIDLDFVRAANRPLSLAIGEGVDPERSTVVPEAVAECVQRVGEGPPTMAALAIHRLSRHRNTWPRAATAKWVVNVDTAVLDAGGRSESAVRQAAWEYFRVDSVKERPSARLSPAVIDYLTAAENELHARWIENVERGFRLTASDPVWSVGASPLPANVSPALAAIALLAPLAQSDDESVCAQAVSVLIRVPGSMDSPSWMARLPAPAQRAMISQLKDADFAAYRESVLKMLLRWPTPEASESLVAEITARGLRLRATDEPILDAWGTMETPLSRVAFLVALSAADMRELIYTKKAAAMIAEVLGDDAKSAETQALREAAWGLAISQARRMIAPARPSTKKKADSAGAFPLLVARSPGDGLATTLSDAARRASRATRSSALAALLQAGFAEEAARAVLDAGTAPAQRDVLLKELATKIDDDLDRDSYLAMLGHLLREESAKSAAWMLPKIYELRDATPAEERWRWTAALKAGVHFKSFDAMVGKLGGTTAQAGARLLRDLTGMTAGDEQRLAAVDRNERAAILDEVNLRMGQAAAGRYAVIAVIETLSPVKPGGPSTQGVSWMPPVRWTLTLPMVEIEVADGGALRATWESEPIGEGLAPNRALPVAGPGRFSPALQTAQWSLLTIGKQHGPATVDGATGPLVLQHRSVLPTPAPGTLTLQTEKLLKAAVTSRKDLASLIEAIPPQYPVTLRYGHFGSFYGCGPELPPAEDAGAKLRILGVMIVMEHVRDGGQ